MKNRFSIGEMSKLHNIPVKTLRYYDDIGLFNPIEVDANNGYRYYSTEQFEELHTINYLKSSGVPLKEIKTQLEKRDLRYFLNLLKKQKEVTENKIKELEKRVARFENRIKEIEQASSMRQQLEQVFIKEILTRRIVSIKEKVTSRVQLELFVRELENKSSITSSIIIGKVGFTVSIENLKALNVNEYSSIFILLEGETVPNDFVSFLPAGKFACIHFSGGHHDSLKYYKILLDYMRKHHYDIGGEAIERTIIDQSISAYKEDHLTEIQIPIKTH